MQCANCGHEIFPHQELCFRCGLHLDAAEPSSRWTVPLGRWFSCPVALHKSGLLLALTALLAEVYFSDLDPGRVLAALGWIAIAASVVLVHELGHLLSMRIQGIVCRQIILYPVPFLSVRGWGLQASARQRTAVALAGPVTSLAVSLILLPMVTLWPGAIWPIALCALHALAGAVNFLPIEPLDGALIFRAPEPTRARPQLSSVPQQAEPEQPADEVEDMELEIGELDTDPLPDVDQILEKILASGLDSLTERERSILQDASRHLRR